MIFFLIFTFEITILFYLYKWQFMNRFSSYFFDKMMKLFWVFFSLQVTNRFEAEIGVIAHSWIFSKRIPENIIKNKYVLLRICLILLIFCFIVTSKRCCYSVAFFYIHDYFPIQNKKLEFLKKSLHLNLPFYFICKNDKQELILKLFFWQIEKSFKFLLKLEFLDFFISLQ